MPTEEKPLGDIASLVLFENERVKIWNLVVEPGEASPWHLHERDYVTVMVEGAGLRAEFEDGTSEERAYSPGHWRYHGEHQVHRVVNNTDQRYKNVLIELKG